MANKKNVIEIENLTITKPRIYLVTIQGMDSLLFNKMPDLGKPKTEDADQSKIDRTELERLTWREKSYYDESGMVYMPGENIHECLKEGSQYWGQKIQGEGNKTYTDVVKSAVICESMNFGIHKDSEEIIPFGKMVNGNPSKGKKSGSKVYKIRPLLRPWGGEFKMHVFDARLLPAILKTIISYAGAFRGLGDWRPIYGRFELTDIREG